MDNNSFSQKFSKEIVLAIYKFQKKKKEKKMAWNDREIAIEFELKFNAWM